MALRRTTRGPRRNRRKRRVKVHTAKWDDCVRQVSERRGVKSAAAVCTASLGRRSILKSHRRKRRRQVNPRRNAMGLAVIYAVKGATRLKYVGGRKFANKGKAVLFGSRAAAEGVAKLLRDQFAAALKGWRVIVGS